MYESLVLIDPDTDITAQQLAEELRRFHEGKPGAPAAIEQKGDTVTLRWPGYVLDVGKSCAPHVLDESTELAAEFAVDHPNRDRIARCACRFEIGGDDDPNMDYFNDSLFVGEALARLGRVYRFDQTSSEFV